MRGTTSSPLYDGNPALRLVVTNALTGSWLGLAFAVALVLLDTAGLGRLIANSDSGPVAFLLLAGGFVVTFGSMVAGSAVMMLDASDDDATGRRDKRPVLDAALAPARVRRPRQPSC